MVTLNDNLKRISDFLPTMRKYDRKRHEEIKMKFKGKELLAELNKEMDRLLQIMDYDAEKIFEERYPAKDYEFVLDDGGITADDFKDPVYDENIDTDEYLEANPRRVTQRIPHFEGEVGRIGKDAAAGGS